VIDLDTYWAEANAEVMSRPPKPEVDELPIRSTGFADGYGVKLTSLGDYRLFAYYSVPTSGGPHPAIYHAPGYASVVGVPAYEERRQHAVLSLCARGQRLSDKPYAAAFPGLLTDRIDDPASYPLRGYVADACRGIDFLKLRPEVDGARIAVVGGDTALLAAALRPEVRAVVVADPFLPALADVAPTTSAYPYEEINDYLRHHPDRRAAVEATLALFDPLRLASRVQADVLITCPPGGPWNPGRARQLASAIGPRATVFERSGRGYLDKRHVDRWIAERLATTPG
jgi:cephalosporin-C deacetylase-like acetyl esterase